MNTRELKRLRRELASFMHSVGGDFQRKGRIVWAERYVRGLLLTGERKSIEPLAQRIQKVDCAKGDYAQSLQQFIAQSTWDFRRVRKGLAMQVASTFGTKGYLIVDDTGFPKWGNHSVGVARQYTGTLGKVDNCQVATTLQFAHEDVVIALDAELYMPKSWAEDPERLASAGVPEDLEFRTKTELAVELIERAQTFGFSGVVLADAGYGDATEFRGWLSENGFQYGVGISNSVKVVDADRDLGPVPKYKGTGRPPSRPRKVRRGKKSDSAKQWAEKRLDDFRKVTWGKGSKGQLSDRFAAWRVRPAHRLSAGKEPLDALWLVAEWRKNDDLPEKFYFATLGPTTSLRKLVATIKKRWLIEHSYKEMKDELGLDHFEGRTWNGWNRHVTLVFVAYAFLQSRRLLEKKMDKSHQHFLQ